MTKVYINTHPTYDYSIAIVQGRLEMLKNYVKETDYLMWIPPVNKKSTWQIHIHQTDIHPEHLEEFISKINAQPDCSIFVRNERSDPFLLWHPEILEGGKTVK